MSTRQQDDGIAPQPQLTWPNIIGTLGVTLVLAGGAWALIQTQLNAIKEGLDGRISAFERAEEIRHNDLNRRVKEFQTEFDRRTTDRRLADGEINKRLDNIEHRLIEDYISRPEFRALEKTADERVKTQTEINRQAIDAYLTVKAWEAWRTGQDKLINEMSQRIQHANEMAREKK